ncbi:MAG: FAD-dependent oxidoreductase, partial [Acidothermales bacterium]|nr:FAD-dependent oxidoreductase [Acidothermales bacterium]
MAVDVVVIGAGQAGLSTGYHLRRLGFAPETGFVVLDADTAPGGAWRHRAGSLTMAKVHGVFRLPGAPFDPSEHDAGAPVADVVAAYLADYERRFALPVHRPVSVRSVSRDGHRL